MDLAGPSSSPDPFFFGAPEDWGRSILHCANTLVLQMHQYPTERSRVAYFCLRLQGEALRWAATVWGGPETESFDSFTAHLQAEFGTTQMFRRISRVSASSSSRSFVAASSPRLPAPTVVAAPTPASHMTTAPVPTPAMPGTREVWIQH